MAEPIERLYVELGLDFKNFMDDIRKTVSQAKKELSGIDDIGLKVKADDPKFKQKFQQPLKDTEDQAKKTSASIQDMLNLVKKANQNIKIGADTTSYVKTIKQAVEVSSEKLTSLSDVEIKPQVANFVSGISSAVQEMKENLSGIDDEVLRKNVESSLNTLTSNLNTVSQRVSNMEPVEIKGNVDPLLQSIVHAADVAETELNEAINNSINKRSTGNVPTIPVIIDPSQALAGLEQISAEITDLSRRDIQFQGNAAQLAASIGKSIENISNDLKKIEDPVVLQAKTDAFLQQIQTTLRSANQQIDQIENVRIKADTQHFVQQVEQSVQTAKQQFSKLNTSNSKDFSKGIQSGFEDISKSTKSAEKALSKLMSSGSGFKNELLPAMQGMVGHLGRSVPFIGQISGGLSTLGGLATKAVGPIGLIVAALWKGTEAITALVQKFNEFSYQLDTIGIQTNQQFEDFGVQFETLLKSKEASDERLKELAKFGVDTPFELPEVVQASRLLETFGGELLSTGDSLTLVGDVAAGVGRPFESLAFWIGRAYTQISSGKSFGEAALALQEMGALSGPAREELEKMIKTGADSEVVWARFNEILGEKFGGNMDKLSKTMKGMQSNLADFREFALRTGAQPLFDVEKQGLSDMLDFLNENEKQILSISEAIGRTKAITVEWKNEFKINFLKNIDLDTVEKIVKQFYAIKETISGTVAILTDGGDSVSLLADFVNILLVGVEKLLGFVRNVVKNFRIVIGFFEAFQDGLAGFAPQLREIGNLISSWSLAFTNPLKAIKQIREIDFSVFSPENLTKSWTEFKETSADSLNENMTLIMESEKALDDYINGLETEEEQVKKLQRETEGLNEERSKAKEFVLEKGYLDQFLEAQLQIEQQLKDMEETYQNQIDQFIEDRAKKRNDLIAKHGQEWLDLEEELRDREADIRNSANEQLEKNKQEHDKKERREEEDHLREMRLLRERYLQSLEDAVKNRDARAIVDLRRKYQLEKRNNQQEFDISTGRDREDFDSGQGQIVANRDKQLAELQAYEQEKIAQLSQSQANEINNLESSLAEQEKALQDSYDKQKKDLEGALNKRLEDLALSLAKEKDITEEQARTILESMNETFGIGGDIDALMESFNKRRSETDNIKERFESFFGEAKEIADAFVEDIENELRNSGIEVSAEFSDDFAASVRSAAMELEKAGGSAMLTKQNLEAVLAIAQESGTTLTEAAQKFGELNNAVTNSGEGSAEKFRELLGNLNQMGVLSLETANKLGTLKEEGGSAQEIFLELRDAIIDAGGAIDFENLDLTSSMSGAIEELENLEAEALITQERLDMIDKIAKDTGNSVEETAIAIGQMYNAAASGEGMDEALQKLQEMGALTEETKEKLLDLAESEFSASGILDEFEKAFNKGETFNTQGIFDTTEVENAKKALSDLAGESFNNANNLEILGKAATETNLKLDDVAIAVSSVKDAMAKGDEIGFESSLEALEKMGLITDENKQKLEEMAYAGETSGAVFAKLINDLEAQFSQIDLSNVATEKEIYIPIVVDSNNATEQIQQQFGPSGEIPVVMDTFKNQQIEAITTLNDITTQKMQETSDAVKQIYQGTYGEDGSVLVTMAGFGERQADFVTTAMDASKQSSAMGADAVFNNLSEVFGVDGRIDQMMDNFESRMNRKISVDIDVSKGSANPFLPSASNNSNPFSGQSGNPIPAFAEGGTLVTKQPTLAMFGEKGPEIASFLPLDKFRQLSANQGVNMSREDVLRLMIEFTGNPPSGMGRNEFDQMARVVKSALQDSGVLTR